MPSARRLLLGILAGTALGASAARASAQPSPVSAALVYEARGASCLSPESLEQMVETELGRSVFVAKAQADMVAELSLEPKLGHWIATLTLRSANGAWLGARELTSEDADCAALDESLALVVALAIDIPREELERATEAQRVSEPAPPPRPRKLRLPLPEKARAPLALSNEGGWTVAPGAGLLISLGLLPAITPGVRVGVSLSPPRFWTIELGATLWKHSDAEDGPRGSHFRLVTGDMAVCPLTHESETLRVAGCVSQTLGQITGQGFGFMQNQERKRFLYMPGLRARAALRIAAPLWLRLGVDAVVPLSRDQFFYVDAAGDSRDVFRVSPVVAIGELGLELMFR